MDETQTNTPETSRSEPSFHDDLVHAQGIAGQPQYDSLADLSEEELRGLIVHSTFNYEYRTFGNLFENNAAKNELRRLQLLKSREENPEGFDDRELIVTDQASTYHQYFPQVVNATIRAAQKYEEATSSVPAEVRNQMMEMEGYTDLYLGELNKALDERVTVANAIMLATYVSRKVDPNGRPLTQEQTAELKTRLEALLRDPKISRTSLDQIGGGSADALLAKVAVRGDTAIAILGNNLNQRIIEVLGGKCGNGVPDGFTPMILELELVRKHYDFVFSQESELSLDARLVRARQRMKILEAEHEMAESSGTAFSAEKAEEYENLVNQIEDRQTELDRMAGERRRLSNQIVFITDNLAKYQMSMTKLTTIQNMFADLKDVPSLTSPLPDTTPDVVRESINRNMEARADFHLHTMEEFLGVVDSSVLRIDADVQIERMSNTAFREFFRKLTGGIADVVTLPVPQLGDLRLHDMARNSITGDLDRALGWPPGVTDFDQMTDDQKRNVREKARSLYESIREFRYEHDVKDDGTVDFGPELREKEELVNLRETMDMIKEMPPASAFVQGVPDENAPEGRLSRDEMILFIASIKPKIDAGTPLTQEERNTGATMYMRLFGQLTTDWGEVNPPSGFIGEYADLMTKIDENIGTHFATASALRELSAKFTDWRDYILYGIVAYFGIKGALWVRRRIRGNPAVALQRQVDRLVGEKTLLEAENAALQTERAALATRYADDMARNAERIAELERTVIGLQDAAEETTEQLARNQSRMAEMTDEIARLRSQNLALEEQIVRLTQQIPEEAAGAIAKRTAILNEIATFANGQGREVMRQLLGSQRTVSTIEAQIRQLVSLDEAARSATYADDLLRLQGELSTALRADRVVRIDAARQLLTSLNIGEGAVNFTDEAAELLWRAHLAQNLPTKMNLIRQATQIIYGNVDQAAQAATYLARSGIAGDVMVAIGKMDEVARVAPEIIAQLTRMGLPEGSEMILRLARNPQNLQFMQEAFTVGGKAGAIRASQYLSTLGEEAAFAGAREISMVKTIVTSGDDATRLARAMRTIASGRSAAECIQFIDDAQRLGRLAPRAMGGLETGVLIAGPIIEAAMLGYDIYELVQSYDRKAEQVKSMTDALDQMVTMGLMTKEGTTYKGPGCEIDVQMIENMSAAEVEANWLHTGVDAAAFVGTTATTIVVLSGTAGPPGVVAGLVVAGAIITVHAGISVAQGSIDQYRRSEFLRAAPPWLLAALGPEALVGQTAEQVIREHTGEMRSEWGPRGWLDVVGMPMIIGSRIAENTFSAEEQEEQKQSVRNKIQLANTYRAFAAEHGDLLPELPHGGDIQRLLGPDSDFLREDGDYRSIVRPLMVLQLRAASLAPLRDGTVVLPSQEQYMDINRLMLPDLDRVDRFELGLQYEDDILAESGRRAMLFYVHHLREQRYRAVIEQIESNPAYDGEFKAYLIDQYNAEIEANKSHHYVFNVHPKTLPRTGQTLVERLVEEKTQNGRMGSRITTNDLAMLGYDVPQDGQAISFASFMRKYVEMNRSKAFESWLETYSAEHPDLPFSFETMEGWGDQAAFEEKIRPTLALVERIDRGFNDLRSYHNDAEMKAAIEGLTPDDLVLYKKFVSHADFYQRYISRWREGEYVSMGSGLSNLQLLESWKLRGYPTLIDERLFTQSQQSVSARPLNNLFEFTRETERFRLAERSLPGFTYDPERPSRRVMTLMAYWRGIGLPGYQITPIANPLEQLQQERDRRLDPFGFNRMREEQEQTNGILNDIRLFDERSQRDQEVLVQGEYNVQKLSDYTNLSTSIAIDESMIETYMASWKKDDGFDMLRSWILTTRVFVIADPNKRMENYLQNFQLRWRQQDR